MAEDNTKHYVGIDLGGTNIAAGVTDRDHKILFEHSVPTGLPRPADELAQAVFDMVKDMLKDHGMDFGDVTCAGIGIPGTVNQETGMVEYANNFGFDHVPFVTMIQELFPCPVFAENDAKAAAWGEYLAGAGQGSSSMVMVTLGTGVGGGIILGGRLLAGYNLAAGEIGHMVIREGGKLCSCGRRGCLEAYASASALVEAARKAAKRQSDSLLNYLCGEDLDKINGRMVFQAAKAMDPAAVQVMEEFVEHLAVGVANIINIFQPEVLCVGGGLSGAGDQLLTPLRERTAPVVYSRSSQKNARIVAAALGNGAGIIGAAGLWEMGEGV